MKFLVATYGSRHIGMLLAHLHSIRGTHPHAGIAVYCQDLPQPQLAALRSGFPEVEFKETRFDFANDRINRISSKTLAWEMAALDQPDGEEICLLDVDTLVVRDVSPFFTATEFDVLFTYKESGFVLNTGVLLCRMNPEARAFFPRWREETIAILRDPERFRQANDSRLPYGAADQMALHQMLGYRKEQTDYRIGIDGRTVRLHGEPTEFLNETRSCPIAPRTHIIHYKGGWQPILLDGRRFTKNRPRSECWEMYSHYLRTFESALERLNVATGGRWRASDFGIHIPGYFLQQSRPLMSRALYALHTFQSYVAEAAELFRGALRLLSRKLRLCPR